MRITMPKPGETAESNQLGPHPSFIQVAKPYVYEHHLQKCLEIIGINQAKEDSYRLQGVAWIDSVRKALRLPVRTFNTAAVYYHRFRLLHSDHEYLFLDAAAAALFTACKIEDTLKRSKEILCAAYNLKLSSSEQVAQDDPMFETHSKTIVGLERLMLEASAFDFRSHDPQKLLIKLAKRYGAPKDPVGRTAYHMSLDLYRTFAPLKQTTQTMALACLELAGRAHRQPVPKLGDAAAEYAQWHTTRAEVMETLLDLLDLYTHHRAATAVGPDHPLDDFIAIRITLNQEAAAHRYPRHLPHGRRDSPARDSGGSGGGGGRDGDRRPARPAKAETNGTGPRGPNGTHRGADPSPRSPEDNELGPGKARPGLRDGTVRFMLDGEKAREEKRVVHEYLRVEEEEYEVEVEVRNDRRR